MAVTLRTHLNDREYDKFEEVSGETAVRVTGTNFSGNFTPQGLNIGGKISTVSINNSSWTALPLTPLANRNALGIQNFSGQEIKLNFDNSTVGYIGIIMQDSSERFYDIKDTIVIYAKSSTSSCSIVIEELS